MRKIKWKGFQKRSCLFLVLITILTSSSVVQAESERVSTVNFNVINADTESSIQMIEAVTKNIPSYLMPQQEYDIKVKVIRNQGLGSMKSLEVKLWMDPTGEQFKESHFNDVKFAEGATAVKIKWNRSDGMVTLDTGNDPTWKLSKENTILPGKEILDELANTEFEFVFRITIGKVARMTEENAKWMLAYQTLDESGTKYGYFNNAEKPGLKMEWYCEVEAPDNISLGNITPGTDYSDDNAKKRADGVKYIANGKFNEQVKFDADWDTKEKKKAAKLTEDAKNSNEFALRVSYTDNLKFAKQIPSDGNFVITQENEAATTYEGIVRDDYHFYIKLNKTFDIGMYSGRITFGVSNGL